MKWEKKMCDYSCCEVCNQMLKSELLCLGVTLSSEAKKRFYSKNPFGENKSIHAASFILNNKTSINLQFSEKYNLKSPYIIDTYNDSFILKKNSKIISNIDIVSAPNWYSQKTKSGQYMHDVLNVHGRKTLAFSNYKNCCYIQNGKKCKFCSVVPSNYLKKINEDIRINDIMDTLEVAFHYNCNYDIALSEGTVDADDRGTVFFSEISKKIIQCFGNKHISAEIAPPNGNKYIDLMIDSGIDSIIMNLEFFDDKIRQLLCPGKFEISKKQYINSLSYAVSKMGFGNVSSVLIAGIEPLQSTIEGAKLLLSKGVLPIIIPFKPYDLCQMANYEITQPEVLLTIKQEIDNEMKKNNLIPQKSHSCIACGSCNL